VVYAAAFLTGFDMITGGSATCVQLQRNLSCNWDELHSAGGVYYKGFVNTVKPAPLPNMSTPETVAAYDPWESVRVEWDVTARDEEKFQVLLAAPVDFVLQVHASPRSADTHAVQYLPRIMTMMPLACITLQWVSPWEIERDPEEDAIWEEKRRKAAEAEARAARAARAKGRRCWPCIDMLACGGVLLRMLPLLQAAVDHLTAVSLPAGSTQYDDDMIPPWIFQAW
jgi:hypothetical protein